jgi:di- and tripeptidase
LLKRRWSTPTIHINNVECSDSGSRTIPRSVTARIHARTVPDQDCDEIARAMKSRLEDTFRDLKTGNLLTVEIEGVGSWWEADYEHDPFYGAAADAIEDVWGTKPQIVQEGGSIPMTALLSRMLDVPIVLLPLGQSSDSAHLPNERLRQLNLTNGASVLFSFFYKLSHMKGPA